MVIEMVGAWSFWLTSPILARKGQYSLLVGYKPLNTICYVTYEVLRALMLVSQNTGLTS